MKKNRILIAVLSLCLLFTLGLTACGKKKDSGTNGGDTPPGPTPPPEIVYGLPVAATGHYIKDADVLDDGNTRYLVYTTNEESGENDNVIAVRSGKLDAQKGWAYGDEKIVLRGSAGAWDANIGSASIVKGNFAYNGADYDWLMAYCATKQTNDTQQQIGLAVANDPCGTWTKVGNKPLIEFDADVYGSSAVGCYAPSLVNLNKASIVRVFYTYADMYGHFAQFVDIDAADAGVLFTDAAADNVDLISGTVQLPTNGDISGGDAATMFPNADFAFDALNGKVYAVKDYSPSAATAPNYAEKIELTGIAEEEFYTVEALEGWKSVRVWDMMDTDDMAYERLYSAAIVSDAYGHIDAAQDFEIVYNVCDIAMDNADWMFSQNLKTFKVSLTA